VAIVEAPNALDTLSAARHVARAMGLWHQGGAATGDVAFWAQHAELFDSPKAYALVIEALLDRQDFVSAMALLISWLECGERIGLEKGDCSFHRLAQHWMRLLWERTTEESADEADGVESDVSGALDAQRCWALSSRFLEFLERSGNLQRYMELLLKSFNPAAPQAVMCRSYISVGWDGQIYDCDFNQMLAMPVDHGAPSTLAGLLESGSLGRRIRTGRHCFGCTAGAGSSCAGAAVAE